MTQLGSCRLRGVWSAEPVICWLRAFMLCRRAISPSGRAKPGCLKTSAKRKVALCRRDDWDPEGRDEKRLLRARGLEQPCGFRPRRAFRDHGDFEEGAGHSLTINLNNESGIELRYRSGCGSFRTCIYITGTTTLPPAWLRLNPRDASPTSQSRFTATSSMIEPLEKASAGWIGPSSPVLDACHHSSMA